MSVLTGATRRNIPEDAILLSHRRENLKSYNRSPDYSLSRVSFLILFCSVTIPSFGAVLKSELLPTSVNKLQTKSF
jgi:hypothetical protein